MRFAGIDVGAERHMVAMVGEQGEVLCRSSPFGEDASGYAHLFELLGPPGGCLLALEATGHYWRNLFVALLAKGYAVAVLNPLRTRRFAEEELQRTKTDAIDALGIARFAAQKRPPATQLPDVATEELRELSRLRDRLQEDFASRLRQLHRAVDLGFPEFTRHVRTLESQLASHHSVALSNCGVVSWYLGEESWPNRLRRLAQDRGGTRSGSDRGSRKLSRESSLRALPIANRIPL